MRRSLPSVVVALASAGIVLAVALAIPIELRHTAPFGFRQTLDRSRGIAVDGVNVTSNYPNFNRVDLDLRAYSPAKRYDLTVMIQPVEEDAEPVRVVGVELPYEDIAVNKAALGNPFTSVRFDPIADSEGVTYYVWVERGPRNQDDILALWSVKSYSRVHGTVALTALIEGLPGNLPVWAAWTTLGGLMVVVVGAVAALILVLTRSAWDEAGLPTMLGNTRNAPESPG